MYSFNLIGMILLPVVLVSGQDGQDGDGQDHNPKPGHKDPWHWHYPEDHWGDRYPVCATGHEQSPIDVPLAQVQFDPALSSFTCNYPSSILKASAHNNGHTLEVVLDTPGAAYCTSVPHHPSTEKFNLAQFHIHFGAHDGVGSEHAIDGKFEEAEVHLVHFNDKYPDLTTAAKMDDGLLVVGILMKASGDGATSRDGNPVIAKLAALANTGSPLNEPSPEHVPFDVRLDNLVTFNRKKFLTYEGSLTTPGCSENVTWVLAMKPEHISRYALNQLRTVWGHDHIPMVGNDRAIHDLGTRKVYSAENGD